MAYYGWSSGTELYHYGIPGQKWGVRRFQNADGRLTAEGRRRYGIKSDYIDARTQYRQAAKKYRKEAGLGIGVKGIRKSEKAAKKLYDAEAKLITEKAKYKGATKGDKAEFREYRKLFNAGGLPGSVADAQSGGRSTRMYDVVKKEKGEKYADKVLKSVQNRAYASIAASAAVAIGANIAAYYLENK